MSSFNSFDETLSAQFSDKGVTLELAPFVVRIYTDIPSVLAGLQLYYSEYPVPGSSAFADFHVSLRRPRSAYRWFRPQVSFEFDGTVPFKPLPYEQAYPMFEWGLNWCIANHCHRFLMIHAAVVEREGCAAILAAPPGSGKSTLCAALVSRGWRLLSDELALIDPATLRITPIPRPIGLKNDSIEIIRHFNPSAVIGPVVKDTRKGTVTHMKAPVGSILRSRETACPAWVIFPRYERDAAVRLRPHSKARTVVRLAENSFNYTLLGAIGFDALIGTVDQAECYEFTYSKLDDAISIFADLKAPPLCQAR